MPTLSGRIAAADGSLRPGKISFRERIESIETAGAAGGDFILPGLIDLQVNGSRGIDVMRASAGELARISDALGKEGTTAWVPTAVTSPLAAIERVDSAVGEAQSADDERKSSAILGMHLEGPFISPRRLGAHPRLNLEPRGESLDRVIALKSLRIVTIAPELPGALEAIARFRQRGVVVSIGHTDADFDSARRACLAGARMFTHLFNAMRPLSHRDPGVVAAALTSDDAFVAVIPDGVHVHPEVLRVIYKARGANGMILTTDKLSLAGMNPSAVRRLGSVEIRIEGGAARLADGTLAGSVISMLDGARLMVERVGVPPGEAALMASTNPARALGLGDRGALETGRRADMIVLGPALELKSVFVAGRELRL